MKKAGGKIKIRIKFCGGCRPDYDRMAAAERIANRLDDIAEFTFTDDQCADEILIIAGCPAVCVDTSRFGQKPVRIVAGKADAEVFIREYLPQRETD